MSTTLHTEAAQRAPTGRTAADNAPERSVVVLGKGRSGTTWIGQILNSSSRCVLKFEPFNPPKASPYRDWLLSFDQKNDEELHSQWQALARTAIHNVDYPPFQRKRCRSQNPWLLRCTWQLGKLMPKLRPVYEWYGKPNFRRGGALLIKQVNFPNEQLDRFCNVTGCHLISVVRNPYGSVASILRYATEPVSESDYAGVRELLRLPGYERYRKYDDKLEEMSRPAFEALRWRIQNEPLVEHTRGLSHGMVVVYEDVCQQPFAWTRTMYEFVGWPFENRVERALTRMTAGENPGLFNRRKRYTVYRDPKQSKDKWRIELSQQQKTAIKNVVDESPILDLWPGLDI